MQGRSTETTEGATGSTATAGVLIPVWRDILLDADTPVGAFARLRSGPFAFLLESAPAGSETWARYTYLGASPRGAWRLQDGTVEDWSPELGWHAARRPEDPFADFQRKLCEYEPVDAPELGAFWGGAVGYFSYDMVRHIERLPNAPPRGVKAPDALFVFTGTMVIIDNLRSQARLVCAIPVPHGTDDAGVEAAYARAHADIDATIRALRTGPSLAPLDLNPGATPATGVSNYSREEFIADVRTIKEYIVAGDCFQALLARRIAVPHDFDGGTLYRAIRALNPSPYMYHLILDGVELVGSSPELHVRVYNLTSASEDNMMPSIQAPCGMFCMV